MVQRLYARHAIKYILQQEKRNGERYKEGKATSSMALIEEKERGNIKIGIGKAQFN